MHVKVYMWMSEDSLQIHMGFGDQNQVIRFGNEHLLPTEPSFGSHSYFFITKEPSYGTRCYSENLKIYILQVVPTLKLICSFMKLI